MNQQQFVAYLNEQAKRFGEIKAYAESLGVSQQYLGDILNRGKAPGKKVLEATGFERVVVYRRKRGAVND